MKTFITYVRDYFRTVSLPAFIITFIVLAVLVTMNYTVGIERRILNSGAWYVVVGGFYMFYGLVLAFAWGLQYKYGGRNEGRGHGSAGSRFFRPELVKLLVLAPLFFALKVVHWDISRVLPGSLVYPWTRYWVIVLQLPAKLLLLCGLLLACRKAGLLQGGTAGGAMDDAGGAIDDAGGAMVGSRASTVGSRASMDSARVSIGLTARGFDARPYFLLLLLLIPVIVLASTQPDFLHYYPKVKNLAFLDGYTSPVWPWKLGYELSYGLDFLTIELFFRGLLIVGLVRYAGPRAILPMAAFYCTVHFGKPLGECITSFFGGMVLGVLAYRTRSILGGLIVHLGLAWMMEIGGWLGQGWLG
jgi:Type II CAAX prenyl endopeptidase Rce1-like